MSKTFQELTIKDPFMFAAAMSNEEQCKTFLSIVLGMENFACVCCNGEDNFISSGISRREIGGLGH